MTNAVQSGLKIVVKVRRISHLQIPVARIMWCFKHRRESRCQRAALGHLSCVPAPPGPTSSYLRYVEPQATRRSYCRWLAQEENEIINPSETEVFVEYAVLRIVRTSAYSHSQFTPKISSHWFRWIRLTLSTRRRVFVIHPSFSSLQ